MLQVTLSMWRGRGRSGRGSSRGVGIRLSPAPGVRSAESGGWRPWWWPTPNWSNTTAAITWSLTSSLSWTWWGFRVLTPVSGGFLKRWQEFLCRQVAGIFHDASIGNAIHVSLVRLILLHGEEVMLSWNKKLLCRGGGVNWVTDLHLAAVQAS